MIDQQILFVVQYFDHVARISQANKTFYRKQKNTFPTLTVILRFINHYMKQKAFEEEHHFIYRISCIKERRKNRYKKHAKHF